MCLLIDAPFRPFLMQRGVRDGDPILLSPLRRCVKYVTRAAIRVTPFPEIVCNVLKLEVWRPTGQTVPVDISTLGRDFAPISGPRFPDSIIALYKRELYLPQDIRQEDVRAAFSDACSSSAARK